MTKSPEGKLMEMVMDNCTFKAGNETYIMCNVSVCSGGITLEAEPVFHCHGVIEITGQAPQVYAMVRTLQGL